jgi:putative copper export protein
MHRGTWLGVSLLMAALVFQIWVTVRLRRTQIFDRSQKSAQTKLIWLVPVVGAAIVFSVLVSEEQYDRKEGRRDDRGQSS